MRRRSSSAYTGDPPPPKRKAHLPVPVALPPRRSRHLALSDITQQVNNHYAPAPPTTPITPPIHCVRRAATAPAATLRHPPCKPVISHAMSDITAVRGLACVRRLRTQQLSNEKRRAFYREMRARFAHPQDNSKCRKCKRREHTSLHHEADFRRAGTHIATPSSMSLSGLEKEVERCARKDGSIGLVSLCWTCHRTEERRIQGPAKSSSLDRRRMLQRIWKRKAAKRNREADNAAKLLRHQCQCDEKCGRVVTPSKLSEFEWDHLVQSFDDPEYRLVSVLVGQRAPLARCDQERKKCRLLHSLCHQRHTAEQNRQAALRARQEGLGRMSND
jgi:hypothetical protein